jgi:lipopolysaccharide/colanic/teichoic acid biosynthesis glycosyltransferase
MNLIIIHKSDISTNNGDNMLRFALADKLVAGVIHRGLNYLYRNINKRTLSTLMGKTYPVRSIYAIPENLQIAPDIIRQRKKLQRISAYGCNIIRYSENIKIKPEINTAIEKKYNPDSWLVVSNVRFATQINSNLLENILSDIQADIVAVNAVPELLGTCEKTRLTPDDNIAGFRRLYTDSFELVPNHNDWPHYLFIKAYAFKKLLNDITLPESFSSIRNNCQSNSMILRTVNVGGTVMDLNTEKGLLDLCKTVLSTPGKIKFGIHNSNKISKDSRFIGKVLLGENVRIDPNVIIVGPAIICRNVHIENGTAINSSIIGPEVRMPQKQNVNNRVIKDTKYDWKNNTDGPDRVLCPEHNVIQQMSSYGTNRNWPLFSYARCLKRITDCFIAIIVLILFAPLIPFIALAIKLNSPGPVFFKDKRQGLHGKEFNCLKFRTMVTGADKIQEKLRFISQVDGPQFKMSNDPRISAVGRFLRETYIDEIPQFFNVLFGQMSVVGPRPSPESENTLCPFWRDARLSVRPGITGLWQIRRTRVPMKDFQEWILYDTEYVRNLSLKTDLWICWQTTKKLLDNFINQF